MTGWYIYAGCFVFSPALVHNNTELYIYNPKKNSLNFFVMTNETSGILMNRFIMILMKHRIHTLGDLTILLFMITRTVQKQKKERYQ